MSSIVLEIIEQPQIAVTLSEHPQIVLEIIEAPILLEMSDAIVNITTDNASFLYDDATAIVFDDGSKVELT